MVLQLSLYQTLKFHEVKPTKNTVSCRGKDPSIPIEDWLSQYKSLNLNITSVFGFLEEFSPLYGGRVYSGAEISKEDVSYLYSHGISIKLTLSANKASKEEYEESKELLDKYHKEGNTVAIVNDDLAKWIKRDYPKYLVEASVIKNTKFSQIDKVLSLYDVVVLPMFMNDDIEQLNEIKQKDKVILFGNAGCAYNCPSKICYSKISKQNKGLGTSAIMCSMQIIPRPFVGLHFFDLDLLKKTGFKSFKFVTVHRGYGH